MLSPMPASRANAIELDSTARMLAMLAGWAGKGQALETTQGIVARHIGKSVRTVQRMLHDAWREGYLTYAYTKNRMGMITGIRIFLRLERLLKEKKPVTKARTRRKQGATYESDTNRNIYINKKKDPEIMVRLERFARTAGMGIPI